MTHYENGFVTKCAEYGVDPNDVYEYILQKQAAEDNNAAIGGAIGAGAAAGSGALLGPRLNDYLFKSHKIGKKLVEGYGMGGHPKLPAGKAALALAALLAPAGLLAGRGVGSLIKKEKKAEAMEKDAFPAFLQGIANRLGRGATRFGKNFGNTVSDRVFNLGSRMTQYGASGKGTLNNMAWDIGSKLSNAAPKIGKGIRNAGKFVNRNKEAITAGLGGAAALGGVAAAGAVSDRESI